MTRNELFAAAETYLENSLVCLDKAAEVSELFCVTGLNGYHEMHATYCEQANSWTEMARSAMQLAKETPL